uniref:Uncharacterized protein n=1 Tax=Conchiformibius kuhniae TaxID=211502 RepID=A0A8T9MSA9_9NEIS|nr:hypothetical protein LVJ77_11600 [Conchiformibius kuhniae]
MIVRIGAPQNSNKNKGQNKQPNKRNIPSASRIEHFLDIGKTAARAEDAIVHVLMQYPDLAEESTLVAEYRAKQTPPPEVPATHTPVLQAIETVSEDDDMHTTPSVAGDDEAAWLHEAVAQVEAAIAHVCHKGEQTTVAQLLDHLDLNGLQLIETQSSDDAATPAEAAAPQGLRRRDRIATAATAPAAIEMVQIETAPPNPSSTA